MLNWHFVYKNNFHKKRNNLFNFLWVENKNEYFVSIEQIWLIFVMDMLSIVNNVGFC